MSPLLRHESPHLRENGPIYEVVIKPSSLTIKTMHFEKKDVPHVRMRALFDTGAQTTQISQQIAEELGLVARGTVRIHRGGHARELVNEYDICLEFDTDKYIDLLRVLSINLEDHSIDCIIGRDVLERCTFIYDGPGKSFALSFGHDRVELKNILDTRGQND